MFDAGAGFDRDDCVRLFQKLVMDRFLDEYAKANGAGYTNDYIRLGVRGVRFSTLPSLTLGCLLQKGPEHRNLIAGKIKVVLDIYTDAARQEAAFKSAARRTSKGKGKEKAPDPDARIPAGIAANDDDSDDIEDINDDVEPAFPPRRGRAARPPVGNDQVPDSGYINFDAAIIHYEALNRERYKVRDSAGGRTEIPRLTPLPHSSFRSSTRSRKRALYRNTCFNRSQSSCPRVSVAMDLGVLSLKHLFRLSPAGAA